MDKVDQASILLDHMKIMATQIYAFMKK